MITWSSEGNYSKQPLVEAGDVEEQGALAPAVSQLRQGVQAEHCALPAWFRDGTGAAQPHGRGEAAGNATGTPARL